MAIVTQVINQERCLLTIHSTCMAHPSWHWFRVVRRSNERHVLVSLVERERQSIVRQDSGGDLGDSREHLADIQ